MAIVDIWGNVLEACGVTNPFDEVDFDSARVYIATPLRIKFMNFSIFNLENLAPVSVKFSILSKIVSVSGSRSFFKFIKI